MNKIRILGGVVVLICLSAVAALAHHSFAAEFDPNKPIKITGKVTLVKWANPHGWIYIDVVGPDGKTVNWALETGPANSLSRRGWRKEDLAHGTLLTVEGWAARSGKPAANASSITFQDGKRLFAGSSNPAAVEQ
jgi:hypothetical protein